MTIDVACARWFVLMIGSSLSLGLLGCSTSETGPAGQTEPQDAAPSDAAIDVPDLGMDPILDPTEDESPDSLSDLSSDGAIECGDHAHPDEENCVCDEGYIESPDGRCVICYDNAHCDGRVCVANVCRDCLHHDECGEGLFCADDGFCTDTPPPCLEEGARRCFNHLVQYCRDETWVEDTSGECPYGCNNDTDACYPDTNVGWIGGRCSTPADCDRIGDGTVECLPPDEGFFEGTCTQRCTGICPDQSEETDSITFCVDSEGLNDAGMCVSRCDFDLFSDAGCRPGYECRQMTRHSSPGVVQAVCLPINWHRNPSRRFDAGVASGEVTQSSAIVWAHTGDIETGVVVEYGTDPDWLDQAVESESTDESGYTLQVDLVGLVPATDYYYRLVLDGLVDSPIGHFKTAPQSSSLAAVRFMFSGDVEQTTTTLNSIFELMSSFDVDFFINMGDWPIGDSADTVSEYRAVHEQGRTDWRIRDFLQQNSVYSIFDDHEVYNDWDAAYRAAHPESVENGLRVWAEWWPLRRLQAGEFYRRYRWGEVEFFFLDCRTHRDARSETDGSDKTMLGLQQREWLLDALRDSQAVFKVIVTSVPLDFGTTGSDSWMGYTWERNLIWETITNEGIGGVVFLAADQHWFSAHHHNSGFKEFMSCPLTRHLREPPSPLDEHVVNVLVDYNFSVMTYHPGDGGSLLIEAYDDDGNLFYSEGFRPGRGRIEVDSDIPAAFTICPRDSLGPDCTHLFDGVSPATFEYAVPGPYRIEWAPVAGFTPPDSQDGFLLEGQTLRFSGEYVRVGLPFADPFDTDLGWMVVDDGDIDAPSDWQLTNDETENGVLLQRSNIYSGTPDGEGPIDKLGTLVFNGDPDWTDYQVSVRFRSSDNDSVGVIARYRDNDNYYRFSLDQQRSFARLVARVDGIFSLLDSDGDYFGYTPGTWTWIRLSVDSGSIQADVSSNGSDWDPLLSATDLRVDAGAVGLYSWGSEGVEFDDVRVDSN